ncbi:MAG: 2-hydroxyacyl-CoA dehydratase [Deltaproteobacteria bacterium]|nr:2-hydroxyacyl-CoA dehydratase [Deltaproteobacteria bacterium]
MNQRRATDFLPTNQPVVDNLAESFRAGIDIGSTTVKMVILDKDGTPLFTDYRRHDARIHSTLKLILGRVLNLLGDRRINLRVTGSAGMGLSERLNIPFIQEVVASAEVAQSIYPDVKTLVDIGGEDSKLIFFNGKGRFDIRMNGNCAGGTGAFIDQMAVLLGVAVEELNSLAGKHTSIFPIASRCGVFAKTDIQALMSRGVSSPDIAISVFHAVALQTINTLARGFTPKPKVIFAGGPLTFLPMLKDVMLDRMGLTRSDMVEMDYPALLPAMGAAVSTQSETFERSISELITLVQSDRPISPADKDHPDCLFRDAEEYDQWKRQRFYRVERARLQDLHGVDCFVGVDSGSTTTKMVLADDRGRIALDYYTYNKGDHVAAVQQGFQYLYETLRDRGVDARIAGTAVTGYGEEFIRTVFGLDAGVVETLAHYKAAHHLVGSVDFMLDIGGQDMKAMFIQDDVVQKIEINEACSSGCGTFLQTFAQTLKCSVKDFAEKACLSPSPCDLGSRCTVFMNSRVKQSLREGADIQDIAAGLAYSVIRNCLNKVLKINDFSKLGDRIVVQGGTFLNPSVHRAFEKLTGKKVICPEIAGLMGAFGCALTARDLFHEKGLQSRSLTDFIKMTHVGECKSKEIHCHGCENQCSVSKLEFGNGVVFYSGNRCERIFHNGGIQARKGINLARFKEDLLFNREMKPNGPVRCTIGIPRVLNMYENFPFWCRLFVELGMQVRVSSPSNTALYEKGAGMIMSDSICFPAKLVHGHIMDLAEKGVDRIFYPNVVYEQHEQGGFNSYNCPIVTGYPEVIRSSMNPEKRFGIPYDTPVITFKDPYLLKKSCIEYFKSYGIRRGDITRAFEKAMEDHQLLKQRLREKAEEIVTTAAEEGRKVILLVGRPYHLDRLINHGVPEMLSQLGVDMITEDSVAFSDGLDDVQVLTQWTYSNRLYHAGKYAGREKHVEIVQINSFGCGLDAVATDEITEILRPYGKHLTLVRVDEIASPGSIRLRLRTLIESPAFKQGASVPQAHKRKRLPPFTTSDKGRKILVPFFSKFHSPFVESSFRDLGYRFEVLPPPDQASLDMGLRYTNNEVCYPAIIVVGDILKALSSGKYDLGDVAAGITQTGAQCRASNYVSLIKKGLLAAGYDIPMITVHLQGSSLNEQPGFEFSRVELMKMGLYALAFADALSLMYHPLLVREREKGSAWKIVQKYLDLWHADHERSRRKTLNLLERAVDEFNRVPVHEGLFPRIGLVGEIYAKYNDFCNHHVVDWLAQNGVEVEVPCLMNFFTQGFVNYRVDIEKRLERNNILRSLSLFIENRIRHFLTRVDTVLSHYRYYRPFPDIRDIANKASAIVDLANQFGEGWLIPGEVMKMAEEGVENILCLQPFGCIANQVIAKGVEKRMRDLYPNLNILFVDLDANTSEANVFNRLHFLMNQAKLCSKLQPMKETRLGSS